VGERREPLRLREGGEVEGTEHGANVRCIGAVAAEAECAEDDRGVGGMRIACETDSGETHEVRQHACCSEPASRYRWTPADLHTGQSERVPQGVSRGRARMNGVRREWKGWRW
jgi:hypothetical protein